MFDSAFNIMYTFFQYASRILSRFHIKPFSHFFDAHATFSYHFPQLAFLSSCPLHSNHSFLPICLLSKNLYILDVDHNKHDSSNLINSHRLLFTDDDPSRHHSHFSICCPSSCLFFTLYPTPTTPHLLY